MEFIVDSYQPQEDAIDVYDFANSIEAQSEAYHAHTSEVITGLEERLPQSPLNQAIRTALSTMLDKQYGYIHNQLSHVELSDGEIQNLLRSQRDLNFALAGLSTALDLYAFGANVTYVDFPYDTHAWYERGQKGRAGVYEALYTVCNDEFIADDEDHESELEALEQDEDILWPDEFHHPGMLKIFVDPHKRIEFSYTPEIETAQRRHYSRSEVVDGNETRQYENSSLSIRLDLDPTAPYGIALDIGRSAFVGGDDTMTRSPDLVGGVFDKASDTGSHEYSGFEPGMSEEFQSFAERFVVQLALQRREHTLYAQQGAIGSLVISGAA